LTIACAKASRFPAGKRSGRFGFFAFDLHAGGAMLKHLNADQAHFIALLAKAAREERDALLGAIDETTLAELMPARGEHNPTAALGLEPLPPMDLQLDALRKAVTGLSEPARREVYTLMRIGQGHLAANKWHRGLSEAETLGDRTVTAAILEDADLHEHIAKGIYEAKISS
jgi:hypothetical protein